MAKCICCGKDVLIFLLKGKVCKKCIENLEFAEQIMNGLQLGHSPSRAYMQRVEKFLEQQKSQQIAAQEVAKLCGTPFSAKGYYIKAFACSWSGAKYRQETIKWTKKWIEADFTYPDMPKWQYGDCGPYESRASQAWEWLAKAYEGEHMFDEALNAYQTAWKIRPNGFHFINLIARVYTKMNRLDDAIALLESTPMMEDEPQELREYNLNELYAKKERGYVFRPRKKENVK